MHTIKKSCYKCGSKEDLSNVTTRTLYDKVTTVTYRICRPCNTKSRRELYAKKGGSYQAQRRSIEAYRLKNKERAKAWGVVRNKNLKKKPCVECGAEKIHWHHPDPNKPLWVVPLCPKHHSATHRGKLELKLLSPLI